MDVRVRNKVEDIQRSLETIEQRISYADPIAKMMLVAMAYQECEIEDKINDSNSRIARKFCDEILLHSKIRATPAITLAHICNGNERKSYFVDESEIFTCKSNKCNYRPIYRSKIIPGNVAACFINNKLLQVATLPIPATWPEDKHTNELWIAYESQEEVNSLEGFSMALTCPINGNELTAEVGDVSIPISLTLKEIPKIFNSNFMLAEFWSKSLVTRNFWLYKFGACQNKRILQRNEIPAWIRDSYSPEILDRFVGNQYLWIRIKTDNGIQLPDSVIVDFNYIPLVNYDINDVKLNYAEPIKSLENDKKSIYFLGVSQEHENSREYFIRDFDVVQYDNERIREDITSLYHHFVNDYFAFVDYNGLHDGATLRGLKQSMIQVYDAMEEYGTENKPSYGGIYAIRNPMNCQKPIVITYFTTNGKKGNSLIKGNILTSSNLSVGNAEIIIDAFGGRDKIKDEYAKNEIARHNVNSCDRLYTKMDLLQFCKTEFMRAFDEDALKFCEITINEDTIPVENHIEKCLTIHFNFNSDNLRQEVVSSDFFNYLEVSIDLRKSCSWNVKII